MFKPLQRVPKWAYYVSGGLVVGVLVLKHFQNGGPTKPTTADQAGATGYTDAQNMPGIVTVPYQPSDSNIDTTGNPDPTQMIGTISDIFNGLIGSIGDIYSQAPIGTGGGSPSAGSTPDPGGVVTIQPVPTPAAPKPAANPCVGMAAGGSAGTCKPAGAICNQQLRCDSNSNGHYCTHKFKWPDGHTNCYNHYSSGKNAGQCVGPFGCP